MARPKGTTKEVQASKRNLAAMVDLKEKINVSVLLEAVDTVLETMRDPNAGAATKRLCANDVVALYFKLNADSLEILAETKQQEDNSAPEEGSTSQSEEKKTGTDSGKSKLIRLDFNAKE